MIRSRKKRFPRPILILISMCLFGSLTWLAFYAYEEGFSNKWRRFITSEFEKRGIALDLERLTLDPIHGLVARNVRIYETPKKKTLTATINHLRLDLDLLEAAREQPFLDHIDLRNATLSLPVNSSDPDAERLEISQLNARLHFQDDRIELREIEGDLYGIALEITGSVALPANPKQRKESSQKSVTDQLNEQIPLLPILVRTLNQLKFSPHSEPTLQIELYGDLGDPTQLNASLTADANDFLFDTLPIDRFALDARSESKTPELRQLIITSGDEKFSLDAKWLPDTQDIQWTLDSNFNLPALLTPIAETPWSESFQIESPPIITASGEWSFTPELASPDQTPATTDDLLTYISQHLHATGEFQLGQFSAKQILFQGLEASFTFRDGGYYIKNGVLEHRTGAATFQAMHPPGGEFQQKSVVRLDPTIFAAFAKTERTQRFLSHYDFDLNSSILVQSTATGTSINPADWHMKGQIDLRNFRLKGTPMTRWEADVEIRDKLQFYRNVRLVRPEGSATAELISRDPIKRVTSFTKFEGTLNPADTVRPFHEKTADHLARYRFENAPSFSINGTVGGDKGSLSDLQTKFVSNGAVEYDFLGKPLRFDSAAGTCNIIPGQTEIDIGGKIFDGALRVTANFTHGGGHQATIIGRTLTFDEIGGLYFNHDKTTGTLDFDFSFDAPEKGLAALRGSGIASLTEGDIYSVPILGPLSKPISALLADPEIGYSVAREASCTFNLADGILSSEDFEALTTAFRISVEGDINLVEDDVDLDARLNFRGAPGILLFPVSKLLEYQGTGSISETEWKPKLLSPPSLKKP